METFFDIWASVLEYGKEKVGKIAYELWLLPILPVNVETFKDGEITLKFSNDFKKNTVVKQYGDMLEEAFVAVCGFPVKIHYTCPEDGLTEDEKNKLDLLDFKNETFTFDNFIVGPSNKFVYAATKAVAADPGGRIGKGTMTYNPLFIYGNSGLGKTHLLNAISYEVERNYPNMKIMYVSCETFANEFYQALSNKTIDEFHEKYRKNIDLFLIDDIQFIAGKTQTEEEFFHTFNALADNGRQVVITADRPPREIHSLTDRLRTRFENGLLADIQPPEFETRCAIIKRKAELLNFTIDEKIVEYIAEKVKTNVRQLEGITKKLHAEFIYGNQDPTITGAQAAIKNVLNDNQPLPVTINRVIDEVSRTTGVSMEDIRGKKRNAEISNARKMCFYIIKEITDMNFSAIGKEFNKDRTTVMYNVEEFDKIISKDSTLNNQVRDIINNIRSTQ